MANVNNPHGLRPTMRTLSGGFLSLFPFTKLVGYGTGIFQWDPVCRVTGGAIQALTTAGTTLFSGVALSYSPASTAAVISCIIAPDAVYEAQDSNVLAGIVAANIGQNANLVAGAGNALRPNLSGWTINDNTVATTNTLDVHLLNLVNTPTSDNNYGPYARVEVMINRSRMANQVVGV